jgi:hypothetical protein
MEILKRLTLYLLQRIMQRRYWNLQKPITISTKKENLSGYSLFELIS